MTAAGPDRTLRMRLGASLGPEVVAVMMALAFLVALGVMLPRAILLPRVIGVLPTVGPAASGGAAVSLDPSASALRPSLRPGAARSVLEINSRLLGLRTSLLREADRPTADAAVIGDLLRQVNSQLIAIELVGLGDLAGDPLTRDVAGRLRDVDAAASDAARRTLGATVHNLPAYRDGARAVADALAPLTLLDREVQRLTGL
jgi:hypothetical protein